MVTSDMEGLTEQHFEPWMTPVILDYYKTISKRRCSDLMQWLSDAILDLVMVHEDQFVELYRALLDQIRTLLQQAERACKALSAWDPTREVVKFLFDAIIIAEIHLRNLTCRDPTENAICDLAALLSTQEVKMHEYVDLAFSLPQSSAWPAPHNGRVLSTDREADLLLAPGDFEWGGFRWEEWDESKEQWSRTPFRLPDLDFTVDPRSNALKSTI